MKSQLNTIEEAVEDIKKGKVVIVVDDEDRENEGDFLTAARNATPEVINFMATHGRGLICAPLLEDRCDELELELMVRENSASYETPFTVSIDLIGHGCTTGISASDRSKTVLALINPETKPEELGKPGHIFPLRARTGGVLRRAGHTEAAVDLARMAGLEPAGVIVEIMNEDGSMARLPELLKIAEKFDLKIISIADLIAYRMRHESLIEKVLDTDFPTVWGDFKMAAYKQTTTNEAHLVLYKGEWTEEDAVLVRVESTSFTHNLLDAIRSDKQSNLSAALKLIEQEGKGALVFVQQEEKQIGLVEKLQSYNGKPIQRAIDSKDYGIGAQILREMGIQKLNIITNSQNLNKNVVHAYGLDVVGVTPYSTVKERVSE